MNLGLISQNIKDFLDAHKLAFVATVSDDCYPNLSPKGTVIGWDSKTLAFADIRSPDTMNNLKHNPAVEINVIDPLSRKGFLFKGNLFGNRLNQFAIYPSCFFIKMV